MNLVNSSDKTLPPEEILRIAAYNDKPGIETVKKKMKDKGVSPERILFTIYVKEMQNPSMIRLQEGNSLFVIISMKEGRGLITSYNADKLFNFLENLRTAIEASRKMGFKELMFADPTINKFAKNMHGYRQKKDLATLQLGENHGLV